METLYRLLGRLTPRRPPPDSPERIVIIKPCCIGDVVLATATLGAVRAHYPAAHITFAVGAWSLAAVDGHPDADAFLSLGAGANPARQPVRLARLLRGGRFDLALSLVRSPWMSAALLLSGIPHRVGLDSGGRGFGYTVRVPANPADERHEARVYLDVAAALGAPVDGRRARVPVIADVPRPAEDYVVIAPAGGQNPGMTLSAKRWPPHNFARLGDALAESLGVALVLVGGPDDGDILRAVGDVLAQPPIIHAGTLSFAQIAALAHGARGYIGNDTGLTHLAAAVGAPTVMIMGPSSPHRYAPYADDVLTLWKPVTLHAGGVAMADDSRWDWERDGISAADAIPQIIDFLRTERTQAR